MPGTSRSLAAGLAALVLSACAGGVPISLPDSPGTPLSDPVARYGAAAAGCADVQTVVAESRVSGSVRGTRVRATLLVGADRGGNARIEALAGPGGPVLVLTARANDATLVFPRDREVVRGATTRDILEALVGVPIDTADLALTLAGCFGVDGVPMQGRSHGRGMHSFDLPGDRTVWTRTTSSGVSIAGGRRGPLTVAYARGDRQELSGVRLLARDGRYPDEVAADLTLTLSSVDVNQPLEPDTFVARVPRDATAVTLDELRRSGPLGGGVRR
jgi:hypothetical protein